MATAQAHINPEVIIWARSRAHLSVRDFAEKLHVKEEKLISWERGEALPTFVQAQDIAAKAHIPFGFLFLKSVPAEDLPLPDLRTHDGFGVDKPSAELIDIIRIVQRRRQWFADFLRQNGSEANPYVGRFHADTPVDTIVADMLSSLAITKRPTRGSWAEYFNFLISRVESLDILVMCEGYINSPSRPLSSREFRGFAISDSLAPVIFINQADSPSAKLFTLIHELAHVWIGKSGISDASPSSTIKDEVLCNAVAAEFLVPAVEFHEVWQHQDDWRSNLSNLETHFRVSKWVLARRAYTMGFISLQTYQSYVDEIQELHRNREKKDGGPSYYVTQKAHIGSLFSKALLSETLSGRVLLRDAGLLLGMKPHNVVKFAKEFAA